MGRAIIAGSREPVPSDNDHDWLGPGLYFWQSDPKRALEWARERTGKRAYKEPFVIGAVIDLGNCFDLTERENIAFVETVYESFKRVVEKTGSALPTNERAPYDVDGDYSRRRLDNAVMRHLHEYVERARQEGADVRAFDTIVGLFTEGKSLYEGSIFKEKTHCQIAVVNPKAILGFFLPRPTPN